MGDVIKIKREKEEKHVITIYDIARYFLSKESMTHLKLQKLCYYAQAWYYTLRREQLVPVSFQAWIHGPVSYALYMQYKQWGWYMIPQTCGGFNIPEDTKQFLDKIYELYGRLSGAELEELTHSEKPWQNARQGYSPNEYCNIEIKLNDMADYYSSLLRG